MTNNQTTGYRPAHLSGADRCNTSSHSKSGGEVQLLNHSAQLSNLTGAELVWSTSTIGGSGFRSIREQDTP